MTRPRSIPSQGDSVCVSRPMIALVLSIAWLAVATTSSAYAALDPPQGEVLLIVDGEIQHTNAGDEAHFDRTMLEALERHGFSTVTPWTEGVQRFEGARLNALLSAVGARSNRFLARATDDYAIEFDGVDLDRYPVILAFLHNDEPMSLRRLGPLRIMFPFDDYPATRTHTTESLSVWQLVHMTVR